MLNRRECVLFFSLQLKTVTFLQLQPLTAEQLLAVVELDQLCFGQLWTLDGYKRELESPNSDLLVIEEFSGKEPEVIGQSTQYVGENAAPTALSPEGDPPLERSLVGIGCLWAILEEAHITILGVHPNYRGQGLGQALLYALLKKAWKRRLEWATLEVRASNRPAQSLYEKFGFQEVGRRRRYYKDTGEDALILWRSGLQAPEFPQTLSDWHSSISDRFRYSHRQFLEADEVKG
ncbi:ribosomal protein S18-alanine N-acetyltransferase [Coleofasciculus sp. FACHB-542]|nr:ribosomal protein S18-alanine N-acetyltransferase [Coleofasciculus sp. FACHB-542]MBD2083981.1 ribosomal protein S18-alanine N-acetyltransferase [Coleofasciculus sp. FACHB-542]